ncbi:FkbM family methyltransferase [Rhodoflexus caldus]|uniref:FkbM family methyltransferase n=1 Tax=Rhodoflexus caldus TaxID=2891236 RepID=UPI002029FC17|nr:FkbM family methyltransferase [Rhodoflexus caldus]
MLKSIIKELFHSMGYEITQKRLFPVVSQEVSGFSMAEGLKRSRGRNIDIASVIDVGASDGRWSEGCMVHYPHARYLLIEAQQAHEEGLRAFKTRYAKADYIIAAAGSQQGEIYFDNSDLWGGLAMEEATSDNLIKVPVTSIDHEVAQRKLQPPYLIKLDTHGYEVPILEGARETLRHTNLIVMEVYNFQIAKNSLRFWEMCAYMEKLGFLPIDMADFTHRKKDNSFWQMDIFFARSDRPEFSFKDYA